MASQGQNAARPKGPDGSVPWIRRTDPYRRPEVTVTAMVDTPGGGHDLHEPAWTADALGDPSQVGTVRWRSHKVTVEVWISATEFPWDGDEPLDEGCTGWDLTVKVTFRHRRKTFWSGDSLSSVWIAGADPARDEYVQECLRGCLDEALHLLGKRAAQRGHVCPHPECLVHGVMES